MSDERGLTIQGQYMPKEMLREILSYLNGRELRIVSSVNTQFQLSSLAVLERTVTVNTSPAALSRIGNLQSVTRPTQFHEPLTVTQLGSFLFAYRQRFTVPRIELGTWLMANRQYSLSTDQHTAMLVDVLLAFLRDPSSQDARADLETCFSKVAKREDQWFEAWEMIMNDAAAEFGLQTPKFLTAIAFAGLAILMKYFGI